MWLVVAYRSSLDKHLERVHLIIDIAYTIVALIPVTVALTFVVLICRLFIRKIALSSGLTPEQADLIASLSNEYGELSRIRAEAGQRENDILTLGEPFTATCREELWAPTKDQENRIAALEQQCQEAGIPKWRICYSILENPLAS